MSFVEDAACRLSQERQTRVENLKWLIAHFEQQANPPFGRLRNIQEWKKQLKAMEARYERESD